MAFKRKVVKKVPHILLIQRGKEKVLWVNAPAEADTR